MWIRSKDYESIVEENRHLRERLKQRQDEISMWMHRCSFLDEQYKVAKKDTDAHKNLCEKYKQKYADEVQKRLELIALYERQTDN